jgi:trigger factor
VTEQELQAALMNRMRQFPGQERMVIDYYRKNPGAMMELRGPIFEQKVVDSLVAKAKLTDKTVTKDELQAMVKDEDELGGTASG